MKTRKENGREGGKKRWAKIPKAKRSAEMRERANQLWAKIRAGKLSTGKILTSQA